VSVATRPTAEEAPAAAPSPAPRERRRLSLDAKARLIQVAILLGLLVVWQVASWLGLIGSRFLPGPIELVGTAADVFSDGAVWGAVGKSGLAMLFAFVIGTALGIAVGFLFGLVQVLKDAFFPVVLFFMSTPKSIFIPLFLLLFGINQNAPIAFAAFATFFYVCVNVVGGVGLVQERHLRVVDAYRGKWWQRIVDVILPASAPGVFAGVWYGIKHAVFEVLIIELYISVGGIGALLQEYSYLFQTGRVLSLVLFVVIVSLLLGSLWNRLESRLERWKPEKTTDQSLDLY